MAYEAIVTPGVPETARIDAVAIAARAYRATLAPAARAALDAEHARQGLAGHTHPRHFDTAWRR